MYILRSISEDGYAEVVDSITGANTFIDPYQRQMLEMQNNLARTEQTDSLEFMLGVFEQQTLYLIARHRDEITSTIAGAYSTKKYITAVEKCNTVNTLFRARGHSYFCTVLPKSRVKEILSKQRRRK